MGDSYISDLAPRSYSDKDGMIQYTSSSRQSQFQSILGKRKSAKIMYSSLSDLEIFLEALKKVKNVSYSLYEQIEDIAKKIDEKYPGTIKYRSPSGIVYGYKYSILLSKPLPKGGDQASRKNEIEELFEEAADNDVPVFDVVRYYRYLSKNNLVGYETNIIPVKIIKE